MRKRIYHCTLNSISFSKSRCCHVSVGVQSTKNQGYTLVNILNNRMGQGVGPLVCAFLIWHAIEDQHSDWAPVFSMISLYSDIPYMVSNCYLL